MGSRRFRWVAGIGVALVVIAFFVLGGQPPRREGTKRKVAVAASVPSRAAKVQPKRPVTEAESPQAEPAAETAEELPPQIQRFLANNIYPPTSGPLTAEATDLLHPNQRYEKPRPVDEDGKVTSLFTADRYYYTGDEVAVVWLEVRDGDRPAAVDIHAATARAEDRDGPSGDPIDLKLRSDGGRWGSVLDLAQVFPDHHGTILLEVAFELEGGEIQREAIRIFSTPVDLIPAQFSGKFRDSVQDGSLLVEVGVDVRAPGFFRFDANLYDRNGAPVAFAVFKGDLAPGENWLPFEFFGKVLRDQGAMGPYSIEQVRGYRFLEGQTPDSERLADEPVAHHTSPYDALAFSDAVYTSEHKERMVALMLEDIDAGRTLDVPDVAANSD